MSQSPDCPCLGGTLDKLIQPAILTALADGPLHGYKLAERINERTSGSAGQPDLSGSYRFLKTMEARRLVVSSWDTPKKGHARRLFQITAEGEACLVKWRLPAWCCGRGAEVAFADEAKQQAAMLGSVEHWVDLELSSGDFGKGSELFYGKWPSGTYMQAVFESP